VQTTKADYSVPATCPDSCVAEGPVAIRPSSDHTGTVRRLLIIVALYAIPAIIVVCPVDNPDIWWHLRTGQWIVEHGMVPSTDPFSSFGQDKPWIAYSWLFEVLIYGLYQWLGIYGILLYRAALGFAVSIAIHHFIAKREPRFVVATGLTGAAFMTMACLMNERPWLFTLLFFTLTLDCVLDLRAGRGRRSIWVLPFLYALWANLHVQFIYGLFILGLACAAPWVDRLLGRGRAAAYGDAAGSRDWWRLVILTGACALATLLNPYHVRLYAVVVEYASQPVAFSLVSEHRAMEFRGPVDWVVLALAGWATFALGRRRRLPAFEVLLLASSAYFSFHTQRDLWFVVLAALAILLNGGCLRGLAMDHFALTRGRLLAVAGGVVLLLPVIGWGRSLSPTRLARAIEEKYPARAASFVEGQGLPGPLYNDFDWGGYLLWRLPHLLVAIDGRTNLHGDKRLLRFYKTWAGERGWDSDPELENARLVISHSARPLSSLLRRDPRFELAYEDPVALIFVARPIAHRGQGLQ
jgi:hypothetical protein